METEKRREHAVEKSGKKSEGLSKKLKGSSGKFLNAIPYNYNN